MQARLESGGVIVAATHAPLGLEGARELRLGATAGAAR
jgi:heme exporter protein A